MPSPDYRTRWRRAGTCSDRADSRGRQGQVAARNWRTGQVVDSLTAPGAPLPGWTPEKTAIRNEVNQWIRTKAPFDGVIDFDRVVRSPTDPNLLLGGVQTNLMPGTGLRSLPINGELYCFEAATGKRKWHVPLVNQMLVLDHFAL